MPKLNQAGGHERLWNPGTMTTLPGCAANLEGNPARLRKLCPFAPVPGGRMQRSLTVKEHDYSRLRVLQFRPHPVQRPNRIDRARTGAKQKELLVTVGCLHETMIR